MDQSNSINQHAKHEIICVPRFKEIFKLSKTVTVLTVKTSGCTKIHEFQMHY